MFDQGLGSAFPVVYPCALDVDSEVLVDRGVEFTERDGSRDRFAGDSVGGADYLTRLHPAPGQYGEIHLGPVVAADLGVDFWCSSELAHHYHGAVVAQSAKVQVLDEGTETLIEAQESLPSRA